MTCTTSSSCSPRGAIALPQYHIVAARPHDLSRLPAIELAAGRLLAGHAPASVLEETTSPLVFRDACQHGRLWVALADHVPVGFALVEVYEPRIAHLEEIDVHPEHGRRGLGRRLVATVCSWAADRGFEAVTLTTFRNVPWNMPFYERLGFEEIPRAELSPVMQWLVSEEARRGLEPARRVVMRRPCVSEQSRRARAGRSKRNAGTTFAGTTPKSTISCHPNMRSSATPRFRVARPSRDLDASTDFYTRALGLEVLATFADHEGIDGVVLGHESWPYHIEFTRRRLRPLTPRPTDEDLLVFYLPERDVWDGMVRRIREFGASEVPSSNPYWSARGVTIEDPDGYRIVIENASWP